MTNKTKIILTVLIMMLLVTPSQASFINDLNSAIENTLTDIANSAKTLAIPTVGSTVIKCNAGATCAQERENWVIGMTSINSAQTIALELQPGVTSMSGNYQLTTGSSVIIEVTEKAPVQTVPVSLNTNNIYILRNGWLSTMNSYTINAYERSTLSSVVTTNYDIVLKTADTTTAPVSKSYDYRSPQTIYLKDNNGRTATISPSHQLSGGITTDVSNVYFVDNGYGQIEAFDKTNFIYYSGKVNDEVQWVNPAYLDNLPQNWAEFLKRMKTLGLKQFTDLPLTKSGNNVIMTYPVGSVGTQLQAVIPKEMAKTVSVIQNWGDPYIDSATLSPPSLIKGQGMSTLTVKVTNMGSTDTISVNVVESNGATVTAVTNSLRLAENQQGTYTFMLNPTVSSSTNINVKVTATAGGSGYQESKTVMLNVQVLTGGNPTAKQTAIVKVYDPNGAILSNAPIFKNVQQVGTGTYEESLPLGQYTFTTDNTTNPQYYAPTPLSITLAGGEPKNIALTFSTVPQDEILDLTWIFWGVLGIICAYIANKAGFLQLITKNPIYIILVIFIILVLYFMYQTLLMLYGIGETVNNAAANPWLPWNW